MGSARYLEGAQFAYSRPVYCKRRGEACCSCPDPPEQRISPSTCGWSYGAFHDDNIKVLGVASTGESDESENGCNAACSYSHKGCGFSGPATSARHQHPSGCTAVATAVLQKH